LPPVEEHRAWKDRLATWGAYAAAAGATMAAAGNAEASIIYVHPTNPIELKAPGTTTFLNAPVVIDGISFTINLAYSPGGGGYAGVHGGLSWFSSAGILVNFAPGHAIGGPNMTTGPGFFHGGFPQHFPLNETGFAGFQLPKSGSMSSGGGGMGWMRVELFDRADNGNVDELEIIDWAYNNAGGPISAGQETSTTPEPGSAALALFALGAAGLLAWRRRRAAAK
jgi:MYXO-CTERM domain-containing protein